MSRVQEIEEQLRALTGDELRELRAWLDDYEDQIWDKQFEVEVAAGKWDALAEKALQEHSEGGTRPLRDITQLPRFGRLLGHSIRRHREWQEARSAL